MGDDFILGGNLLLMILASILGIIIIISGCSLLYLYLRAMRFSGPGSSSTTGDLTNIMILFQSMRETLDQQKELARNFNVSIDTKVNNIRKAIQDAGNLTERVATAEKELNDLVGNAKEELASVKRRLGYLQEQVPGFEEGASDDNAPTMMKAEQIEDTLGELSDSIAVLDEAPTGTAAKIDSTVKGVESKAQEEIMEEVIPSVMDAHGNVVAYDGTKKLPPLNAIAAAPLPRKDFIDHWTGVDFGVNTQEEPVKIAAVEEPEDPEASRDAFRALLNMQSTPDANPMMQEQEYTANVAQDLSPMQRRVYEFSDAGMRVAEISRELGVGKGEVKLILNMRKKQA